jgi:putative protease
MEALIAVFSELHKQDEKIDGVLVLGDIVGYGVNPNECCTIIKYLKSGESFMKSEIDAIIHKSDIDKLARHSSIPVECIVHGSLPSMLLEHCLPAMLVTKTNAKSGCRLPCRYINYGLKDEKGEIRTIEVDQYCRNHIMFASDLCVLPYLNSFLMTDVETFRIEAQYYEDDLVETLVNQYRKRMDLLMENPTVFYPLPEAEWKDLVEKSPKELSLCAYSQNVTYSRSTLEVMKTATQAN